MSKEFYPNKRYQVLTPDGFKPFSGVSLMGVKPVWRVETEGGLFLECTHDHKLFVNGNFDRTPLSELSIGDELFTTYGFDKITGIKDTGKVEHVYDLIEVEDGHRYYANKILSSNCEFISFEETLINPVKLNQMESQSPVRKTGQVRWYGDINPACTYVVGLDPAMGSGGDNAAIQVIELPSMKQIAEWQHNRTPVEGQLRVLKNITDEIYSNGQPEIFWSIESNSIGEAAMVVIRDTGEEYFRGTMLHDPERQTGVSKRRKGFVTTNKSKLEACAKLKSLIEGNKISICSRALISELKNFIAKSNTYEARSGTTDDLVMSMILVIRMIKYVASWDDETNAAYGSSIIDDDDYVDEYDNPMPLLVL